MIKKGVHPNMAGFEEHMTGYCATISSDHAYIHAGIAFSVPIQITNLAAGSAVNLALTTPDKSLGYIHWRPASMAATANLTRLSVYEDSAYTGGTPVMPRNRNRNATPPAVGVVKTGATAALTGKAIMPATAGGNFANQPGGGKVTVVSDDVADIGQTVTVYGTKTGATTTVTSEVITLNGTTAVDSVLTTWQNILGIELSAVCAGTITIKNASAATIITIATTDLSAGVITTFTTANALDTVVRHDASGASTAPLGIIGTSPENVAISSVDALNGTTEEDHNADVFRTITKILVGAIASSVNVNVLRPEVVLLVMTSGSGGNPVARSGGSTGADDEWVLKPSTDYIFNVANIGTSTATDVYITLFGYDEAQGLNGY